MATILFRLLIIQIAIHIIVSNALEGQTAHYVNILDSSPADSEQLITCPVYSITPQSGTTTFTKYIASAEQANAMANGDWIAIVNIASFKECAKKAVELAYKMFLWDEGLCGGSTKLFSRLPEPCNNITSTLVYMVPAPALSCDNGYFVMENNVQEVGQMCGGGTNMDIYCKSGRIIGVDNTAQTVSHDDGEGCIIFEEDFAGTKSFMGQYMQCTPPRSACAPTTDDMRAEFVQDLAGVATVAGSTLGYTFTVLNFKLDSVTTTWVWDTMYDQPTGAEWADGYPISGEDFGYINSMGLLQNGPGNGVLDAVCCYKPHNPV